MRSAVRERIDKAPEGTWFRPSELGGGNSVEQLLSRLARDPDGPLVRAAKGLYFKCGQPDEFFGKRAPSPVETAVQVARGQGVGPAGPAAAAFLGLTTQVAPKPALTVVGTPPAGVDGVRWEVRKNPLRAQLNYSEVAVVEMLSLFPSGVEADWDEVVSRIDALRAKRTINLDRISTVIANERRKPDLRRNLQRLTTDLSPAA
jgi:hypothetical protein